MKHSTIYINVCAQLRVGNSIYIYLLISYQREAINFEQINIPSKSFLYFQLHPLHSHICFLIQFEKYKY